MKLLPGERLAASNIATASDLCVVLRASGKFKVLKFTAARSGPRNMNGDYVVSLPKNDRVCDIAQIVPLARPGTKTANE